MPTAVLQIEKITNRTLEIVRSGTFNSAAGVAGTTTTATYTHNLGYVPILIAYLGSTSTIQIPLPTFLADTDTTDIREFARVRADVTSTTLTVYTETAAGQAAAPFPISFYLLKETAK